MKKTHTLFNEKLGKYSAMGAAFLLTPTLSNANVQFTDVNPDQSFGPGQSINVDLNGDAIDDVVIRVSSTNIFGSPLNGAALAASGGSIFAYPFAIAYGATISAGLPFVSNAGFFSLNYGSCSFGNWCAGTDAYLGVRFNVGPNTHFGYIHLDVASNNTFVLKDYAWEDTPDTPIEAGAMPIVVPPIAPMADIPTMSQWGKFLYGLMMYTLLIVFVYNWKKAKDAKKEVS